MRIQGLVQLVMAVIVLCSMGGARAAATADQTPAGATLSAALDRGRYMILTGHCNNCHTAGYAAKEGRVPEDQWLLGNPVGWRSKAGTVYATNLRIYVQAMPLAAWLVAARNARPRAPMPWWSLRETSDEDLTAMYWYMKSLLPAGTPAPTFLPADQAPPPPYNQLPDLSLAR